MESAPATHPTLEAHSVVQVASGGLLSGGSNQRNLSGGGLFVRGSCPSRYLWRCQAKEPARGKTQSHAIISTWKHVDIIESMILSIQKVHIKNWISLATSLLEATGGFLCGGFGGLATR